MPVGSAKDENKHFEEAEQEKYRRHGPRVGAAYAVSLRIGTTASRCRGGQCAILNMSRDSGVHKSKKPLSISLYVQYRVLSSMIARFSLFHFREGTFLQIAYRHAVDENKKEEKRIKYITYSTVLGIKNIFFVYI